MNKPFTFQGKQFQNLETVVPSTSNNILVPVFNTKHDKVDIILPFSKTLTKQNLEQKREENKDITIFDALFVIFLILSSVCISAVGLHYCYLGLKFLFNDF